MVLYRVTLHDLPRKKHGLGVLTIYRNPEILVGTSKGSCHSVWGASENMGCDLRGFNIFLLF